MTGRASSGSLSWRRPEANEARKSARATARAVPVLRAEGLQAGRSSGSAVPEREAEEDEERSGRLRGELGVARRLGRSENEDEVGDRERHERSDRCEELEGSAGTLAVRARHGGENSLAPGRASGLVEWRRADPEERARFPARSALRASRGPLSVVGRPRPVEAGEGPGARVPPPRDPVLPAAAGAQEPAGSATPDLLAAALPGLRLRPGRPGARATRAPEDEPLREGPPGPRPGRPRPRPCSGVEAAGDWGSPFGPIRS